MNNFFRFFFIPQDNPPGYRKKIWALWIFLLALIVRFLFLNSIKTEPWFRYPQLDAAIYHNWAGNIAGADFPDNGVFLMNPGYPYLLSIIYSLAGKKIFAAALAQSLAGAANALMVFLIALEIFSFPAALIASLMAVFHTLSVFYGGFLLSVTLINTLNLLALLLLLKGMRSARPVFYPGAGISLGLSILCRPNAFLFGGLVFVFILLNEKKRGLINGLLFAAGLGIAVLPASLKNYLLTKESVMPAASAGYNFYIGNNPEATGSFRGPANFDLFEKYRQAASRRTQKNLSYSGASACLIKEALRFIAAKPFSWLKLIFKKFLIFWNKAEIPSNISFDILKKDLGLFGFALFPFALIAPLGLYGMAVTAKKRFAPVLFIFVISYLLANLLFFVLSEYRFPVVPVLMIFAAAGLENILRISGSLKKTVPALIALTALWAGVNLPEPIKLTPFLSAAYYNLGTAYYESGEIGKSIEYLEKAGAMLPGNPPFLLNLGNALFAAGNYEKAKETYAGLLKTFPGHADGHNNLGFLHETLGEYPQALAEYGAALLNDPEHLDARVNLAGLLNKTGRFEEALTQLRKASGSAPENEELGNKIRELEIILNAD